MKATTQQVVEALGRHGPVSVERLLAVERPRHGGKPIPSDASDSEDRTRS